MRPLPTAAHPAAPSPAGGDRSNTRTTIVVRLGLIVLALLGVISIFGEPLLGLGGPGVSGAPGSSEPAAAPAPGSATSP
jgi:hypothetical protein